MKPVVPHSYISPSFTVAKLNTTDTAFKAPDMVEQPQAFNDHGRPSPCIVGVVIDNN